MKRAASLCLALALLLCGCASAETPAATPEPAPTAVITPAPTAEPAPVPTPEPTPEPTPCPHELWENGVCAACGEICTHPAHDPETRLCTVCGALVPHSYERFVCTKCGEAAAFNDTAVPRELFRLCEHPGTVEMLRYQTADYRSGLDGAELPPIEKRMAVYLPYGYDPQEKYDVLILVHGMDGTEEYWLLGAQQYDFRYDDYVYTPQLLDNMMEQGLCRKMIVAAPCFYRDSSRRYDYYPPIDRAAFTRELRDAILPALVGQYSTWAEEPTAEAISKAREHFAYAGLSMGSMYVYSAILPENVDLFASFGCFSGSEGNVYDLAEAMNTPPRSEWPIRLFFNSGGDWDKKYFAPHLESYKKLVELCDGLTEGENAVYVVLKNHPHVYSAWSLGLYDFLPLLFPESGS